MWQQQIQYFFVKNVVMNLQSGLVNVLDVIVGIALLKKKYKRKQGYCKRPALVYAGSGTPEDGERRDGHAAEAQQFEI